MQSNYAACLKQILKYEGGYVNNPNDPGGETNYGVTKATAKAHGYTGPMRTIPMSVVEGIYAKSFWNTPSYKGDTLDAGVDLAVFDFGVNSGPSRAGKYLKAAVGGSAVDTVKKLCAARLGFMKSLRTWATFGGGWSKRVASVEAIGVKMALEAQGKKPDEVKKDLQDEQKKAQDTRNTSGTIGAGTGSGGATQAPNVPADPSAFDWHTLLYVGIGVAVVAVVIYCAVSVYNNHQRAAAYAQAAKET